MKFTLKTKICFEHSNLFATMQTEVNKMKSASIVFIIVSFVVTAMGLLGAGIYLLQLNIISPIFNGELIAYCCAAIAGAALDTTIGIIAHVILLRAKEKKELKVIGILTLIFCSLLAGIFMLLIKDEELKENSNSNA